MKKYTMFYFIDVEERRKKGQPEKEQKNLGERENAWNAIKRFTQN